MPAPDTDALSLDAKSAFAILLKAREFDAKTEEVDPDDGSNPTDDNEVDVLEFEPGDATEAELVSALNDLDEDARLDLIALIWIGRGDFSAEEWDEARQAARDITVQRFPRYVTGLPMVSDFLEEGLAGFGLTLADYLDQSDEEEEA